MTIVPEQHAVIDWLEIILRLGVATAAGAMIGLNRDLHGKPIGLRTLAIVSLASAIVVLTAEGYPGSIRKGRKIVGIDEANALEGVQVLHAGTSRDAEGALVSSGGRVLGVVGIGDGLQQAVDNAYRGVATVSFEGMQHRTDIASRGLAVTGSRQGA